LLTKQLASRQDKRVEFERYKLFNEDRLFVEQTLSHNHSNSLIVLANQLF